MQRITCLDCGYVAVNYSDIPIKFCPDCDSTNLTDADLPVCDICGKPSATVIDIEVNPYAVLGVCEHCRNEHNMEEQ